MGNQYSEAISDADRFIGLYPGNPSASYAYYLKAVCYFEQIVDVNRDQAATEQAMASLRDVVQRYPNSEYAQDARLKIDMVSDQLAGKEMTIGRYYLKNGQTLAAIGRFRTVVDRHQTTSHTPEALYRLVESYLTLGLLDEAKRNGAVLGYNFPGDPWYGEAYKLLTNNGLKPAVEPLKAGNKKNMLDRLIHDKDDHPGPAGEPQPAGESKAPGDAKPPAKPKKGGVMGVLGM
jgi:outer membrane protein assembly factor BamD